ncbi:hypothetical protein MJO47_00050 [Desulfuromonas sp. KJ2020]|nr:hypothetical protein [Desulfuromonas sp. KJ2020]MCP3175482.1 hypothetical protein [Desulfuromonas sp. KJ2020]
MLKVLNRRIRVPVQATLADVTKEIPAQPEKRCDKEGQTVCFLGLI